MAIDGDVTQHAVDVTVPPLDVRLAAPNTVEDALSAMLSATLDYALLVLILSAFVALVLTGLLELGLRQRVNRRRFREWFGNINLDFERIGDRPGVRLVHMEEIAPQHVFRLPYRQVCAFMTARAGQIAAEFEERAHARREEFKERVEHERQRQEELRARKSQVDAIEPPEKEYQEENARADAVLDDLHEQIRGLDYGADVLNWFADQVANFQQQLGSTWFRQNYLYSLAVALLIGAIIYYTPNSFEPGYGVLRQAEICTPTSTGVSGFLAARSATCPEAERMASALSGELFLLLSLCFFASLVAPLLVDQIERRLLLR